MYNVYLIMNKKIIVKEGTKKEKYLVKEYDPILIHCGCFKDAVAYVISHT